MLWFKHDSNANMDGKLQEVLLDYGLEGYGLYFYCLELIVNKISADNITFELEHDARIIARNTGSTVQRVEEMMRSFVRLGLFSDGDNGNIVCKKLLTRLDSSMTSNPKMRTLIQHAKVKHSHDGVMMLSDSVMQEENRIEQNRIEEIRKNNIKKQPAKSIKRFVKPTVDQIKEYCHENKYNNVDPENFFDSNEAKGWVVGKTKSPMKDWKAAVRTWQRNGFKKREEINDNDTSWYEDMQNGKH